MVRPARSGARAGACCLLVVSQGLEEGPRVVPSRACIGSRGAASVIPISLPPARPSAEGVRRARCLSVFVIRMGGLLLTHNNVAPIRARRRERGCRRSPRPYLPAPEFWRSLALLLGVVAHAIRVHIYAMLPVFYRFLQGLVYYRRRS